MALEAKKTQALAEALGALSAKYETGGRGPGTVSTGAGDRGGDVGLGRIADRGLQRLVGDRLRGIDQLGERGDAGVGGLQDLHAVADAVEQVADVAGAGIEAGGGEEVGRIVERGIDLLAGGKAALGGREQISSILQREQVLTDRRGESDV